METVGDFENFDVRENLLALMSNFADVEFAMGIAGVVLQIRNLQLLNPELHSQYQSFATAVEFSGDEEISAFISNDDLVNLLGAVDHSAVQLLREIAAAILQAAQ